MIRLFFTGIVIPAVGAGLCVKRVTLVCDFSHNQPSEIAVEIEAVLDSRVQARLRKQGIFATCQLRPSALLAGDGRLVRSGMLSDLTKSPCDLERPKIRYPPACRTDNPYGADFRLQAERPKTRRQRSSGSLFFDKTVGNDQHRRHSRLGSGDGQRCLGRQHQTV